MARMPSRRDRPPHPEDYPAGPVRDLAAAPAPPSRTPVSEVEFLAVDVETTGLDPRSDHVIAIGWVPVEALHVELAGAREVVVRPPDGIGVGQSAMLHRLTDDALAAAPTVDGVLPDLLADLHGRVLLAHHAPIELDFLGKAAREAYGAPLSLTAVDTLALHHQFVVGQHGEIRPGALRLDEARRHFGLPRYRAHRAVTDAVATGELLLAQVAELEHRLGREPVLADLSPTRRR
jgi:DNA polymerase III subunit epsilon